MINLEEMRKQVNKWDKQSGIKLKAPDMWREPENYFRLLVDRSDCNLLAMICCVNGVDPGIFIEEGNLKKGIKLRDINIRKKSCINWDSKKLLETDTLEFRVRFITLVLMKMLGNMEEIVLRYTAYRDKDRVNLYEHAIINIVKINALIRDSVVLLITEDAEYKNAILFLNELLMYTHVKKEVNVIQSRLNSHVIGLRNTTAIDPFTKKRFMTEDMSIYTIIKIAYMLTTNRSNLKKLPDFEDVENSSLKYNLIKLIEALGHTIIDNKKINKLSPMFRAFCDANPKILTDMHHECEYNYYLRMGILALGYTAFIVNDDYVTKFISKMMVKRNKK